MSIEIKDRFSDVLSEFEKSCEIAMESCGLAAEGYAKRLCPVDTGNLRNSISHTVVKTGETVEALVGTPVEYGVYVEMGTGKYVPGGSPPWSYKDDQGNWHHTSGNPPKPFIKPAVADHEKEYASLIRETMKK